MVRIRSQHPPTVSYVEGRTNEGLSKRETIRRLKRYVVREIDNDISTALATINPTIEPEIAA